MTGKKTLRVCSNGHKHYKSSDCPTCPVCEKERKPVSAFLSLLSAPARRALEHAGIITLKKLSQFHKTEILALHGLGPSAIPKLEQALHAAGLEFEKTPSKSKI